MPIGPGGSVSEWMISLTLYATHTLTATSIDGMGSGAVHAIHHAPSPHVMTVVAPR